MSQLSITNVINISVSQASPGLNNYNTSNLGLFTDEAPDLSTFGSLGYALYVDPQQVGVDFGTSSTTYEMANAIFSQQPNILNGDGQLVIILITNAVNHLAFSGTPASGVFKLTYNANSSANINWNDTADQIQVKARAVAGLEGVVVTGSMATSLDIKMGGIYAPLSLTTSSSTLATSAPVSITITVTTPTAAEDLGAAITRAAGLVQFFGIICNEDVDTITEDDMLDAAAVVQALNKMAFFVSDDQADIASGGSLDLLRTGSFTKSRGLYYGDSDPVLMMAAYAGRALSTNFGGSNTTQTMHLKVLTTIQPDTTMTQTILGLAQAAGADVYASFQGVPGVFCSGENSFFDQVYNLCWIVGALQVAGFNYLAQSATKVPQTENGMDGLKAAYRAICEQAVANEYLAAGSWTSSTIFGNPSQFILNIAQRGYYIYSIPVALQNAADRADREAPLVQIALKEAGAIQSSNVIVVVNA